MNIHTLLKDLKELDDINVKQAKLYLSLLLEYIDSYKPPVSELFDKRGKLSIGFFNFVYIGFSDYVKEMTRLIQNIDKQKYQLDFHNIYCLIFEILNTVFERDEKYLEAVFYSNEFVLEATEILTLLSEAIFERREEDDKDKEYHHAMYRSLIQSLSLFSHFCIGKEMRDIMINEGGLMNALTTMFTNNKKAKKTKLWMSCCQLIFSMCNHNPLPEIELFDKILIAMAEELTEPKYENLFTLHAILPLMGSQIEENEAEHRVKYIRNKINMLFDVTLDCLFSEEIEQSIRDDEEYRRICLGVMTKLVQYDVIDYTYKFLHKELFCSFVELMTDPS